MHLPAPSRKMVAVVVAIDVSVGTKPIVVLLLVYSGHSIHGVAIVVAAAAIVAAVPASGNVVGLSVETFQ